MVIDSGSSRKQIRVDSVLRGQGRDPKDEQRQLWEHLGKNTYSRRNRKCRALELGMLAQCGRSKGRRNRGGGCSEVWAAPRGQGEGGSESWNCVLVLPLPHRVGLFLNFLECKFEFLQISHVQGNAFESES